MVINSIVPGKPIRKWMVDPRWERVVVEALVMTEGRCGHPCARVEDIDWGIKR